MVGDIPFQPKRKKKGIMVLEFLLFFTRLGLSHLSRI